MSRPDHETWLDPLEPPPGGLDALRRRLDRHERQRKLRAVASTGLVAAVLAVGLAWLFAPGRGQALEAGDDLLAMQLGLIAAPTEPVSVPPARSGEIAVSRVSDGDDRVVYYRVGRVQR